MNKQAPPQTESVTERPTVDEMSEWSFPASDPPAVSRGGAHDQPAGQPPRDEPAKA